MSSIVVAGDTSGSVTISAPAVAGTPTLTLPTTSGTILTTTGGVSPGTAGNLLTSNGTTWTSAAPAASGGMTLLGTLTTTSGTTQTLSGLTLTNYKTLFISVNGFSSTDAYGGIYIPSNKLIAQNIGIANVVYATCWIDLSTGVYSAVWKDTGYDGVAYASISTLSTSSTSITFTSSLGSFDAGSIKVYGVA